MQNLPNRSFFRALFLLSIVFLISINGLMGQANVQVRINSGSSSTTCDDGIFGGSPDPHWRVQIAGQGYTTYPQAGICFTDPPNTQYNEDFDCALPATLQVCLRAFEDDGGACIVSESCLTQNCQNFAVPAAGAATYNINVGGASTATCNFTITTTGSLFNQNNDFICDAIDLGTIPFGGQLGNENNYIYNNVCATGTGNGDYNPSNFSNESGVWFSFTTGPQVGTALTFEFESDGALGGTFGDLLVEAVLVTTSNGACTGTISEVGDSDDFIDLSNNETIFLECPEPNTTYYVMVDGGSSPLDPLNLFDEEHGEFGIGIYDNGVVQSGDQICDAENLGGTFPINVPLQQSNVCATNTNDPPVIGDWSIDPTEQQGVWFQFTAPPSGSVGIYAESTANIFSPTDYEDIDIQIAVYGTSDNTCTGTIELIEQEYSLLLPCLDVFSEELDVRCLTPGDPYWIFIDGDDNALLVDILNLSIDGTEGYFNLTITDLNDPPAPNDDVCDAISLGTPTTTVTTLTGQSNHCAENLFEPIGFGWGNDQGVWYSFVAPPSGVVDIWARNILESTCALVPIYEDAIRLELAVFETAGLTCGGTPSQNQNDLNLNVFVQPDGTVAAESDSGPLSNDNTLGGIGLDDELNDEFMRVECLTPGETYYLMVDGNGSGLLAQDFIEGEFIIEIAEVNQTPPTGNNEPCDAIALGDPTGGSVGGTGTLYNNYCADDDNEPQPVGFDTEHTTWFSFTAPAEGSVNIVVNSGTDDINVQIALYGSSTGDCTGQWAEIQTDDGFLSLNSELDEVYCLTPGEEYFLLVDGEEDDVPLVDLEQDFGNFNITITEIPTLPNLSLNDLICDAVDMGTLGAVGSSLTSVDQNNLCANNIGDPPVSAFGTDYTVWYEFTTPPGTQTHAVEIFAESEFWSILDPFNFDFDAVSLQLALFESSDGTCNGALSELGSDYELTDHLGSLGFDETLEVYCLEPSTTYYIMVDGATLFVGDIGTGQGNFDITVTSILADPAAPNNDICEQINLGTVPVGGSINDGNYYYNFCADTEMGEPEPFGIDQTVWFTFTAPNHPGALTSSNVTINLTSQDYTAPGYQNDGGINIQAAVYVSSDGTCNGTMTEIVSNDPLLSYDNSMSVTCLTPGETYYLQVDGADDLIGGIEGYFTIEIVDDGTGLFPFNDNVCDAAALGPVPNGGSISDGVEYSNLCATVEPGEYDPDAFGLDSTVWFTFQAPASGNVLIDADQASNDIDLQLAVYYTSDNTCNGIFVELESAWDGLGIGFYDEDLELTCLVPGQTYFIQVDGSFAETDGTFTIDIIDQGGTTTFPYNNDICDAFDFGTTYTTLTNETNECANVEPLEPGQGTYADHTVWYEFIAPPSGQMDITVDADGWVPEFHVFSSSSDCTGTFTELTAVDGVNLGTINALVNCMIPGQTYYIQVDSWDNLGEGLFDITLLDPFPNYGTGGAGDVEPPNNECVDAIEITVQDESCFIGGGIWLNENYGQPTISVNDAYVQGCNPNGNCGDTWYCYTSPSSGLSLVEANDDSGLFSGSDVTVVAYTGNGCGELTPFDCEAELNGNQVSFEVSAPPGDKVWLQVFGGGGDDFDENFDLCVSEQCGANSCLNAIFMEPNVAYCWDTDGADGEDLDAGEPGYAECGATIDGGSGNPEHSIYFSFTSDCNGGSITVSIFDVAYDDGNPLLAPCSLGLPQDGWGYSLYEDSTPCDNNPDNLVDCESFDGCNHTWPNNYSFTYENLEANTDYILQIDGGIYNFFSGETGGNVEGYIMITTLTNPDIDSIHQDSIDCFGETATLAAEVSGGAYPYTFDWDGVSSDSIYSGVGPGWHYVTVTADNGCEEVDSIFVPEPPLLTSTMEFDPDQVCYGEDATAIVHPDGGTQWYDFLWSNSETDSIATTLQPGTDYTVTITDENGCTTTNTVSVPDADVQFIR